MADESICVVRLQPRHGGSNTDDPVEGVLPVCGHVDRPVGANSNSPGARVRLLQIPDGQMSGDDFLAAVARIDRI